MSWRLRLTVLGCGSSPGTPRINGDWGACDPANPKNRRRRASALLQRFGSAGTTNVVIDCGPDFREQMISAAVGRIDAVVITHPHADHIHGLDDIRGFALDRGKPIPVHADAFAAERLLEGFRYCFIRAPGSDYPPITVLHEIAAGQAFSIDGPGGPIELRPFRQIHGSIHSLGFRVGPLAYCSDVSDFPEAAIAAIGGAEHIVIDALQYKSHPSHLSLSEALVWIERLDVPGATLTHMHTPLDYDALASELPLHIRPAFDGMTIDFTVD